MQPSPAARPAEFDARVLAHIPMLQKLAAKYCHPNEREETVQDTVLRALECWDQFRPEGSFYKWMRFKFMHVSSNRKSRDATRSKTINDPDGEIMSRMGVAPRQEDIVYANQIVRRLSRTREGRMLVRVGGGERLKDIGTRHKIQRERVRQLTERARRGLKERVSDAAS